MNANRVLLFFVIESLIGFFTFWLFLWSYLAIGNPDYPWIFCWLVTAVTISAFLLPLNMEHYEI